MQWHWVWVSVGWECALSSAGHAANVGLGWCVLVVTATTATPTATTHHHLRNMTLSQRSLEPARITWK